MDDPIAQFKITKKATCVDLRTIPSQYTCPSKSTGTHESLQTSPIRLEPSLACQVLRHRAFYFLGIRIPQDPNPQALSGRADVRAFILHHDFMAVHFACFGMAHKHGLQFSILYPHCTLEDWKAFIWTEDVSVNVGVQCSSRDWVWRRNDEAFSP